MSNQPLTASIRGQAMAEFVVMVAGCLLLMFVLVPVLGKLTDMSYKSQEMARYAAWERTVWYGTANDYLGQQSRDNRPTQFDQGGSLDTIKGLPTRSNEAIFNSAENRLLSFNNAPQPFSDDDLNNPAEQANNRLWRWTSGNDQNMTLAGSAAAASELRNDTANSIANTLVGMYNGMMRPIAGAVDILSFGQGDEDLLQIAHPGRNLYSSDVRIPVSLLGSNLGTESLIGDRPLSVNARAGILADAWVAQDESHLYNKANDFVLGTALEENPLWGAIKFAVGLVEPSIKNINMAPVNTDPIPDAGVACNPRSGFCYLDD